MTFCPACGAAQNGAHAYCANCGAAVATPAPAAAQTTSTLPTGPAADRIPIEVLAICVLILVAGGLLLWAGTEDLVHAIRTIHSPRHTANRAGRGLERAVKSLNAAKLENFAKSFQHSEKAHFDSTNGVEDNGHFRMLGALGVAYAAGLLAIGVGLIAQIPGVRSGRARTRWLAGGALVAVAAGALLGSHDYYSGLLRYAWGNQDFSGPTDLRLLLAALSAIAAVALLTAVPKVREYFDRYAAGAGERPSVGAARLLILAWAALTIGESAAFVGLTHLSTKYTVLGAILLALGGIGLVLASRVERGAPFDRLLLTAIAVAEAAILIVGTDREMTLLTTWFLLVVALSLLWVAREARAHVEAAGQEHPMPGWVGRIAQAPAAAYASVSRPPTAPAAAPLQTYLPPPAPEMTIQSAGPAGQRFCHNPGCGLQAVPTASSFCPACGTQTT